MREALTLKIMKVDWANLVVRATYREQTSKPSKTLTSPDKCNKCNKTHNLEEMLELKMIQAAEKRMR